jgi:hypothetical protein
MSVEVKYMVIFFSALLITIIIPIPLFYFSLKEKKKNFIICSILCLLAIFPSFITLGQSGLGSINTIAYILFFVFFFAKSKSLN